MPAVTGWGLERLVAAALTVSARSPVLVSLEALPCAVPAQPSALRCGLQGAPADVLAPCHGSGLASRLRLVRWSCSRSVCEEGFGRSRGRERGTGVFSETLHYLTTPGGPALAEITLLPCRCFAWLGHSLDGSCTELHSGSVSLLHLRAVSILVNCTIAAAQDWTLVVCPTELA